MIAGADFLFEAVHNSVEAGADKVHIVWACEDGIVKVRVLDNGSFTKSDRFFEKGYSGSGEKRGMGLFLLKEAAPDAALTREGDETLLSFTLKCKSKELSEVLPFIFPLAHITFEYIDENRKEILDSHTLASAYGDLESAKAIREMKKEIRRRCCPLKE